MEEGSLLQEALNRENALENALLVDVYLLSNKDNDCSSSPPSQQSSSSSIIDQLLALADTAVQLNAFLQSSQQEKPSPYPWFSGGDGPVFGIHVSEGIPHLRTICRYSVSVADEWALIGLLLEYSASLQHHTLVMECWDIDDGQVLLIQSADVLPDWVDRIGPPACRHRCWIQAGQVCLIKPSLSSNTSSIDTEDAFLSLREALTLLQTKSPLVVADRNVTAVIQETIQRHIPTHPYHRAAVAVPRSVAGLLQRRPDLAATACRAFCQYAQQHPFVLPSTTIGKQQQQHSTTTPLAGTCHDWVWTTHAFGRTHYAMLCNLVAATPDWKTQDAIPSIYQSVEVKQVQRQCTSLPHLKHGLQLGVRLAAGLDYLLCHEQAGQLPPPPPTLSERRVLQYWNRINHHELRLDDDWLFQAWEAGPNHALHNLDSVLKCPVYEEEVQDSVTPLSHPGESLAKQVQTELKKNTDYSFVPPRPQDVDNDEWMTLPDEQELSKIAAAPSASVKEAAEATARIADNDTVLDDMLGGVQSFMKGQSALEGVATRSKIDMDINPTVFLNLLHATLKARSADELSFPKEPTYSDPFFSKEDYEMAEPDEAEAEDEDNNKADSEMTDLMNAMDRELQESAAVSRQLDQEGISVPLDSEVAESTHVLSNLMKSLDSTAAASGPVQNLLKEMGIKPRNPQFDEQS